LIDDNYEEEGDALAHHFAPTMTVAVPDQNPPPPISHPSFAAETAPPAASNPSDDGQNGEENDDNEGVPSRITSHQDR